MSDPTKSIAVVVELLPIQLDRVAALCICLCFQVGVDLLPGFPLITSDDHVRLLSDISVGRHSAHV